MADRTQALNAALAKIDSQYWEWAWNYFKNQILAGKWIDDIKWELSRWAHKSTSTTSNSNKTGYTNYNRLTWNQITKNTAWWTATDLSYMKPTSYHGSGNKWDKSINIDEDPDRLAEVEYNVWEDQIVNPALFKNRNDYNKYYNYSWSSESQQRLLDELWLNANKYWLDSYQNKTADDASKVLDDKNRAQYKIMEDISQSFKRKIINNKLRLCSFTR